MKLLIDIPEHIYEHAKETTEDSNDEFDAMRAIANGTPARCMDEAEKERLIKKNMLSIENRVRHAFNQGYDMGIKESRSEIPNTCGDAISRQAVIDRINKQREGLEPEIYPQDKIGDMAYRICIEFIKNDLPSVTPQPMPCGDAVSRAEAYAVVDRMLMGDRNHKIIALEEIQNLPSVTPQQRTGRWIKQNYGWNWQCSECGFVTPPSAKEIFTFCPNCGAKMEVRDKE